MATTVILYVGTLVDSAVKRFVRSVGTIGLLVANLGVRNALLALEYSTTLEFAIGASGVLAAFVFVTCVAAVIFAVACVNLGDALRVLAGEL